MNTTTNICIVHARPGAGLSPLDRVTRSILDNGNGDVIYNRGYTFKQPPPPLWEPYTVTEDFWYDNIEFTSDGTFLMSFFWWPRFDDLKQRCQNLKIIVLTFQLDDIPAIAKNFTRAISQKEIPGWQRFLKSVLETNSAIYPNPNATWDDLTDIQKTAFTKILENVILIEQDWAKTVPDYDYILEIPFRQFWTDPTTTVTQIKTFLDITRETKTDAELEMFNIYQKMSAKFITDYLS
jgi:hypothetical protein